MVLLENHTIQDRYKLLEKIGEGGIGDVYLAQDLLLSRKVAIKNIRKEFINNPEVRKRIDRECTLHAKLGVHPNLVALHDKVSSEDNEFLILELVQGQTLAELLRDRKQQDKTLQVEEVIQIISQVLDALSYIHDHNIVHRDIKPANIILQKSEKKIWQAKLTDFGIAFANSDEETLTRLTVLSTGGPGTPLYMAPERFDPSLFGPEGAATDLYSVGIVLYELLEGVPPFKGSITEIITGHLKQEPKFTHPVLRFPEKLQEIVIKATEKAPCDRYQKAEDFLADLAEFSKTYKLSADRPMTEDNDAKTQLYVANPLKSEAKTSDQAEKSKSVSKTRSVTWPLMAGLSVICILMVVLLLHLYLQKHEDVTANHTTNQNTEVEAGSQHQAASGSVPRIVEPEAVKREEIVSGSEDKTSETSGAQSGQPDKGQIKIIDSAGGIQKSLSTAQQSGEKSSKENAAWDEFIKARKTSSSYTASTAKSEKELKVVTAPSNNVSSPHASSANTGFSANTKISGSKRNSARCANLLKSYQLGDSSQFSQYVQECSK